MGQGHPGNPRHAGAEYEVNTGAIQAGETAYAMAGVGPKDIGVRELYDCYTYTTLVTLEDYGFAPKGEGGRSSRTASLVPAARTRRTPAAASSPATTCGG